MNVPVSISVAVCTFNSEQYLPAELDSIAGQTVLPDEVIFCDDGSTDRTLEILSAWQEKVPFSVKVEQNPETLGYTQNFERAVSLCTRDVILLADHDDLWLPDRIETTRAAFERDEKLALFTSDAEIIDADGRPQGMTLREYIRLMRLYDFWRFFLPPGVPMTLWTGCTMALRRRVLPEILPIAAGFPCHDVWFYLTAPFWGNLCFESRPLIQYRLHGHNHSTAPTADFLRKNPSKWRYFNTFLETLAQHGPLLESLESYALRVGNAPYLRQLQRHARHFQARRDGQKSFFALFAEVLRGGYFTHPQPVRSILYDILKRLKCH